jgi:hypothetical protein
MRTEIAAADRRFEVRRAATRWRKAGLFDEATEQAVAASYADDRVRTTRLFRVLFFVFTWFGFTSAFGLGSAFFFALFGENTGAVGWAVLHLLTGLVLLFGAELLHTQRRMRRFGVEEALVWIGLGDTIGGGLYLLFHLFEPSIHWIVAIGGWASATGATLVAWRWGTPWTGYWAAIGLFVALSQAPASHLIWIVASLALAWPLAHLSIAGHISPEGRRRFREAFVVTSVAAYIAFHILVVETQLFGVLNGSRRFFDSAAPVPPDWMLLLSPILMVALPAVWIGAGLARRYRPAIVLGMLMMLATATTFVLRARLQPAWLVFLVSGLVLIALALLLRRLLAARAGAEWRGITALPLADDRESALDAETLAALVAFAPSARRVEAEGFVGQGGEFGGGGASAKF